MNQAPPFPFYKEFVARPKEPGYWVAESGLGPSLSPKQTLFIAMLWSIAVEHHSGAPLCTGVRRKSHSDESNTGFVCMVFTAWWDLGWNILGKQRELFIW